jgi:hypothetical protein
MQRTEAANADGVGAAETSGRARASGKRAQKKVASTEGKTKADKPKEGKTKAGKAAAAAQKESAASPAKKATPNRGVWTPLDERRERKVTAARLALRARFEAAGMDADDDADLIDGDDVLAIVQAGRDSLLATAAGRDAMAAINAEESRGVFSDPFRRRTGDAVDLTSVDAATGALVADALGKATETEEEQMEFAPIASAAPAADAADEAMQSEASSVAEDAVSVSAEAPMQRKRLVLDEDAEDDDEDGNMVQTAAEGAVTLPVDFLPDSLAAEAVTQALAPAAMDLDMAEPAVASESGKDRDSASSSSSDSESDNGGSDSSSDSSVAKSTANAEADAEAAPISSGISGLIKGLNDTWRGVRSELLARIVQRIAGVDRALTDAAAIREREKQRQVTARAELALLGSTRDLVAAAGSRAQQDHETRQGRLADQRKREMEQLFGAPREMALAAAAAHASHRTEALAPGFFAMPSVLSLVAPQAAVAAAPQSVAAGAKAAAAASAAQPRMVSLDSDSEDEDEDSEGEEASMSEGEAQPSHSMSATTAATAAVDAEIEEEMSKAMDGEDPALLQLPRASQDLLALMEKLRGEYDLREASLRDMNRRAIEEEKKVVGTLLEKRRSVAKAQSDRRAAFIASSRAGAHAADKDAQEEDLTNDDHLAIDTSLLADSLPGLLREVVGIVTGIAEAAGLHSDGRSNGTGRPDAASKSSGGGANNLANVRGELLSDLFEASAKAELNRKAQLTRPSMALTELDSKLQARKLLKMQLQAAQAKQTSNQDSREKGFQNSVQMAVARARRSLKQQYEVQAELLARALQFAQLREAKLAAKRSSQRAAELASASASSSNQPVSADAVKELLYGRRTQTASGKAPVPVAASASAVNDDEEEDITIVRPARTSAAEAASSDTLGPALEEDESMSAAPALPETSTNDDGLFDAETDDAIGSGPGVVMNMDEDDVFVVDDSSMAVGIDGPTRLASANPVKTAAPSKSAFALMMDGRTAAKPSAPATTANEEVELVKRLTGDGASVPSVDSDASDAEAPAAGPRRLRRTVATEDADEGAGDVEEVDAEEDALRRAQNRIARREHRRQRMMAAKVVDEEDEAANEDASAVSDSSSTVDSDDASDSSDSEDEAAAPAQSEAKSFMDILKEDRERLAREKASKARAYIDAEADEGEEDEEADMMGAGLGSYGRDTKQQLIGKDGRLVDRLVEDMEEAAAVGLGRDLTDIANEVNGIVVDKLDDAEARLDTGHAALMAQMEAEHDEKAIKRLQKAIATGKMHLLRRGSKGPATSFGRGAAEIDDAEEAAAADEDEELALQRDEARRRATGDLDDQFLHNYDEEDEEDAAEEGEEGLGEEALAARLAARKRRGVVDEEDAENALRELDGDDEDFDFEGALRDRMVAEAKAKATRQQGAGGATAPVRRPTSHAEDEHQRAIDAAKRAVSLFQDDDSSDDDDTKTPRATAAAFGSKHAPTKVYGSGASSAVAAAASSAAAPSSNAIARGGSFASMFAPKPASASSGALFYSNGMEAVEKELQSAMSLRAGLASAGLTAPSMMALSRMASMPAAPKAPALKSSLKHSTAVPTRGVSKASPNRASAYSAASPGGVARSKSAGTVAFADEDIVFEGEVRAAPVPAATSATEEAATLPVADMGPSPSVSTAVEDTLASSPLTEDGSPVVSASDAASPLNVPAPTLLSVSTEESAPEESSRGASIVGQSIAASETSRMSAVAPSASASRASTSRMGVAASTTPSGGPTSFAGLLKAGAAPSASVGASAGLLAMSMGMGLSGLGLKSGPPSAGSGVSRAPSLGGLLARSESMTGFANSIGGAKGASNGLTSFASLTASSRAGGGGFGNVSAAPLAAKRVVFASEDARSRAATAAGKKRARPEDDGDKENQDGTASKSARTSGSEAVSGATSFAATGLFAALSKK